MSAETERFLLFVAGNYPSMRDLWITEGGSTVYDEEAVGKFFGTASVGQSVILKSLLSIWSGRWSGSTGELSIEFFDLAILSPDARRPLIDWLANPFFP